MSDGNVDYLKTVSVEVLDCKKNVSFIAFRRVVYCMKRIYHFCCKFGIVNLFQEIFCLNCLPPKRLIISISLNENK